MGWHSLLQHFLDISSQIVSERKWMPAWSINLYNIPSPIQEASLFFIRTAAAAKSLQLCPTLSNRMDCSLPGSSVHGIFQAWVLERGAIAFSEWGSLAAFKKRNRSLRFRGTHPDFWDSPEPSLAQLTFVFDSHFSKYECLSGLQNVMYIQLFIHSTKVLP